MKSGYNIQENNEWCKQNVVNLRKVKQVKAIKSVEKNQLNMIKYTKNQKKVFFEPTLGTVQQTILIIINRNRIKLILSLLLARFFMYLPFSFINKEYPMIQGSKISNFAQIMPKYLLISETIECIFVSIFCGLFMDLYSMFSISQLSMVISIVGIAIQGMSINYQQLEIFCVGYSLQFFVKLAYLVCFEKIIFDSAVSFRQASVNSSLLNIIACLARIISCIVSYFYSSIGTVQYISLVFSGLGMLSHLIPLRVLLNTYGLIEKEKMNDEKYRAFVIYKNYNLSPQQIYRIYWTKDYILLLLTAILLLFITSFKSSTYIRHIIPNQAEDFCLMYTCFSSTDMGRVNQISFIEYFLDALHQLGGLLFCTPIVYVISSKTNSIQLRYKTLMICSLVILFTCLFQIAVFMFRNDSPFTWNIIVISLVSITLGTNYYLIRTLLIQLHFAINPSRSSVRGIGIAIIATFTEFQSSLFSFVSYDAQSTITLLFLFILIILIFIIFLHYYLKGKCFQKVERIIKSNFQVIQS